MPSRREVAMRLRPEVTVMLPLDLAHLWREESASMGALPPVTGAVPTTSSAWLVTRGAYGSTPGKMIR
jgi:hypothetical protein